MGTGLAREKLSSWAGQASKRLSKINMKMTSAKGQGQPVLVSYPAHPHPAVSVTTVNSKDDREYCESPS